MAHTWGQVTLYAAIHEAHLAGVSNRAIARQTGLTHGGVQKIIDRWPEQAAELGMYLVDDRWHYFRLHADEVDERIRGGVQRPEAGS